MMPPYRTVLIDDHRIFSDGLTQILGNSTQFTVVEQVFDSRRAYDACSRLQPDLVLVDYNMPYLDGESVVVQLGLLTHACRIVVISLYTDQAERARLHALNVDGYLAKTLPADRLLTLLNRVMQGERVIDSDLPSEPFAALAAPFWHPLTKRELDILKGIEQGLSTEQIAIEYSLSYSTVQTYRKHLNRKLPFLVQREL